MSTSSFPITRSTKVLDCDFPIRAYTALNGAGLYTIGDVLDFAYIYDKSLHQMVAALNYNIKGGEASYRMRKQLERIKGCGYKTASSVVTEISRVADRELRMTTSVAPVVTYLEKLYEAIEKELWLEAAAYCEVLAKIKNIT